MPSMVSYPKAAMERSMKVQEVMLRAMAKKITWWQAAEIIGISDRHRRRWRERHEEVLAFAGCLTAARQAFPQARTSSFAKNSILLWVTKILFQAGQATNFAPQLLDQQDTPN